MPRQRNDSPSYLRHRASGRARLIWTDSLGLRHEKLLPGKFGSKQSLEAKSRIELELASSPNGSLVNADGLPVAAVLASFLDHAEKRYRDQDGNPTDEIRQLKTVITIVQNLYGESPAAEFGPLKLKAIRQKFVDEGWNRKTVNARVDRVRRIFRWAVADELVPPSVLEALSAVPGLEQGRTSAPEGKEVQPADPRAYTAALPHLPVMLSAALQVIYLTGARPSEVLRLRPREMNRMGEVWILSPERHKGTWRGRKRKLYLGPEAQAVLAPWLLKTPGPDEFVFCPARAEADRNAERSANRKVKLWPSHAKRNATKRVGSRRKRNPGEVYDANVLCRAVTRACEKAEVAPFTPYQLRHLRAAELREMFGLEHARAVLGHTVAAMTGHYAQSADAKLAATVAKTVG